MALTHSLTAPSDQRSVANSLNTRHLALDALVGWLCALLSLGGSGGRIDRRYVEALSLIAAQRPPVTTHSHSLDRSDAGFVTTGENLEACKSESTVENLIKDAIIHVRSHLAPSRL